ncbi:expressed unknown protein [Seminavis robusta]|uniref:Uncharacterized protein n=1 Tax=Seminavis robusta TaxID=568900 RepID=A0A9N8EAK0_9STRA|nr:expressed unknown protein [Seminavis robusta]|eukprot:Sro811_g205911.1  (596) ;mRNA; f:23783-25570
MNPKQNNDSGDYGDVHGDEDAVDMDTVRPNIDPDGSVVAAISDVSTEDANEVPVLQNARNGRISHGSLEFLPTKGQMEKVSPTQEDEQHALLQMATEVNEAAKLEEFSSRVPADASHGLMQMATEITEVAKLEEFSNNRSAGTDGEDHTPMQTATETNEASELERISRSRPTERAGNSQNTTAGQLLASGNGSVPETMLRRTPQGISQLRQPGAYMGTPGEALQRTSALQYSLVGAPATNTDDIDQLQTELIQTDALPHVLPNVVNNHSDQQLAVANLVVEDAEHLRLHMIPPASQVDMQMVEERQQKKRRQAQLFLLFVVMLCIVAAIVVGTVAGTRKGKDPVSTSRIQTATPTAFGSMEPSGVPSSAPTGVLDYMLEDLPNNTIESLQTFGTPQWRARDWLLDHQNITKLPEWRKTQLFALATFYYSFEGENWFQPIQEKWMDDFVDECLWYSSGFSHFDNGVYAEYPAAVASLPCNHLGEYTSLWIEDLNLPGLAPVVPREIILLTSLWHIGLGFNEISLPFTTPLREIIGLNLFKKSGWMIQWMNVCGSPVDFPILIMVSTQNTLPILQMFHATTLESSQVFGLKILTFLA